MAISRKSAQVKPSGRTREYSDGYVAGSCSRGAAPTYTTGMPCAARQSRRINARLSITDTLKIAGDGRSAVRSKGIAISSARITSTSKLAPQRAH
jgi:hypothetical protein